MLKAENRLSSQAGPRHSAENRKKHRELGQSFPEKFRNDKKDRWVHAHSEKFKAQHKAQLSSTDGSIAQDQNKGK
jgi:hypothetical protein